MASMKTGPVDNCLEENNRLCVVESRKNTLSIQKSCPTLSTPVVTF